MKKTMIIVMGLAVCGRYMAPVSEERRAEYRAARARVGKKLTDIVYKAPRLDDIVGDIKNHLLGETPLSEASVSRALIDLENLRINSYAFGGQYLAEVFELLLSCFVGKIDILGRKYNGIIPYAIVDRVRQGYVNGRSETSLVSSFASLTQEAFKYGGDNFELADYDLVRLAIEALREEGAREQLRNDLDEVVARWKKDPEYGQPAQVSTTTPDRSSVEYADKLLGEICSPSLTQVFKYLNESHIDQEKLYAHLLLLDGVSDDAEVYSWVRHIPSHKVGELREEIRNGKLEYMKGLFAQATRFEGGKQMEENLKKYWDGHLPKFKGSIAGIDQGNLDTELEAVNKILLFKVFESILSELSYNSEVCRIFLQYIPPKLMPEMQKCYRSGGRLESEKCSIAARNLAEKAPEIVKELSKLSGAFIPGYVQTINKVLPGLESKVPEFLTRPGQQPRLKAAVRRAMIINAMRNQTQGPNQSGGSVVVEGGSSSSTAPVATFIPASSEIPTTDVNRAVGKKDMGVQTESPQMVEGGVQTV